MEMGPSGFLLKTLVTTHLDIRSYSSHAPPQGIKTNSKYKYKVKHEGKDKDICKKCEDKDKCKKCEDKGKCKDKDYTGFSYTWVVSCLLTNSKIVAKSLQFQMVIQVP